METGGKKVNWWENIAENGVGGHLLVDQALWQEEFGGEASREEGVPI